MSDATNRTAPLTHSSSPDAAPVPIWLEVVEGPERGARHLLEVGTVMVGSAAACQVALSDPAVSRSHAAVEVLAGAVRVRDLGSRNGTFYLGARIDEARVPLGGTVRVGKTTLRFSAPQTAVLPSPKDELQGLVGRSLRMKQLFTRLEQVAPGTGTVLIQGEPGSGKDRVAKALHTLSPGAAHPFVVFDCAAVNPNLVESELFGHVRGAFTGALRSRAGVAEAAQEGTLVLNEVGEMPLELQPRLLRLLDAREFQRVGDERRRPFRGRVVATTHHDLEMEVAAGRFRSDLYFRLSAATLEVPPLRQRLEDIPVLAVELARELRGVEVELAATTLAAMQCHPWPGNVRELRNTVERTLTFGGDAALETETNESATFKVVRERMLAQFERDYLQTLLARHRGNVSAAAREAGLSRSHFYRLMERHGVQGQA